MKLLGIVLVVLGALALLFGGIPYNERKTILDMGPLKATATEQRKLPIPPIVGGIVLAAGVLLVARRRPKSPGAS